MKPLKKSEATAHARICILSAVAPETIVVAKIATQV